MATLLPRGKQQFIDATGAPLVGGKVFHYIPGTTTAKDTYQDANASILNTNPIILDGRGEAVIYGTGSYRQLVQDSLGNTIWDQLTTDTSSTNNIWGGASTGSANAQVVLAGNFSSQSGQTITFLASYSNTGALTVNGIPVLKDTLTGPVNLTGGEVVAGNSINLIYDATIGKFHLAIYPFSASAYMPLGGGTFTGAVAYASSVAFGSSGANLPDSAVLGLGTGGALLYADPNNVQLRGGVVGIQFARSGDGVILSAVNSAGNFYSVGEIYAQGATGFRFPDSTTQASSFPVPTASAGRAQWVAISTASTSYALPAGGTWAYFVAGFNGSGIFRTSSAGVAAGGSTIYSDGSTTSVTGFAWRYA